jgi:hypothetical protein
MIAHHRALSSAAILRLAVAILAVTFLCLSVKAAKPEGARALSGVWAFDSRKSSFVGAIPYRSGSYTFRNTPQGVHVTAHIIEGTGQTLHFEYTDPLNGGFVPVSGNPFYDSQSTVWTGPRTATRTERRAEQITGVTTMTVAADGRSYAANARRTLPDGRIYTSVIIWNRVGD